MKTATWGRSTKGIAAALTAAALLLCLGPASALAIAPTVKGSTVSAVTSSSAVFEAEVNPNSLPTTYHFEYGPADCASSTCTSIPVPDAGPINGSSFTRVEVPVAGLTEATIYHFRIVAQNGTTTNGPDRVFATYSQTFIGLPDGRAYEQATPVDKNGGDAVGQQAWAKAALDGGGIGFGSTFGIPGGKGAQALPAYLGTRSASGWSTQGLLPPVSVGERARVMGWLADDSEVFSKAIKLGDPRTEAFIGQSTVDQTLRVIAPYRAKAEYFYAGASADASTILFEARVALPPKEGEPNIPGAINGASNLYAWDRASGEIHLAGTLNDGTAPSAGTFAGSFDWVLGDTGQQLREGGAARSYDLYDTHAVSEDGDVYFAAAGTGQLYLRLNPTQPQSPVNGEGKCTNPALACTLHVSASHRTKPDPAGEQSAVFQGASADGTEAFFTSRQMLTDDANTGPEQSEAQISRDTIDGNPANIEKGFIPEHAIGIATDATHIYWVDPSRKSIGRADLDGQNKDPTFIPIPDGECETTPGNFIPVPSSPRYLAVDAGHIYWTNTGRRDSTFGEPIDKGGSIGRAAIDGDPLSIEPTFICGASNPQGIGVSATHIYWANAAQDSVLSWISRATIDGTTVEGKFFDPFTSWTPYGVTVNGTHLYFVVNDEVSSNNSGYIYRTTLAGTEEKLRFIGEAGLRGLALDATHVYWASQHEGAIGRADLDLENSVNKFIETEGTVTGIAATPTHIHWAVNGEAPTNPGNDLYRFKVASETLDDLSVDEDDENGAEVQGVLGVSADGSRRYVAANGDLDGAGLAVKGNCKGTISSSSGKCNLYLLEEGAAPKLVARLDASDGTDADSLNWVGTPVEALNTGSYEPRTAFLSNDGEELLFRSQEKLTAYDNETTPELYLYSNGAGSISCVSCRPSGEAVAGGPSLGSLVFPELRPPNTIFSYASRILSASGGRVFFETTEALSPADTNGQGGCPPAGSPTQAFPACLDVYEWEAPEEGSCKVAIPAYSPLNDGCLYLISTGKSKFPSLLADASLSGADVFFFTRDRLVGQDEDELQDVYDARIGGGLASQNPPAPPVPCESTDSCHGPAQSPPLEPTPATPNFVGPSDPTPKHKPQKAKKHKKKHKKHKKQKSQKGKQSAKAKGRNAR